MIVVAMAKKSSVVLVSEVAEAIKIITINSIIGITVAPRFAQIMVS
jgi:hypothetical protein